MRLARSLAILVCAAALLSCAETQDGPPAPVRHGREPAADPQMGMVVETMNQQADLLERNGQTEQAALTRKLAQDIASGKFGSDPMAAMTAARKNIEETGAATHSDLIAKEGAPTPIGASAHPQGGVVGGAISPRAPLLSGRLAVLDLRNFASDLTAQNASYFTDVIRQETLRAQPGLQVMTRENLLVLLQASGKKIEDCEGECEVDTGRRIGADLIVSGEIQKVGSRYKISIRLHDTKEGRLLGSAIASGNTIDALDDEAAKAVKELYATAR